jgi:hypothetical protein
MHKTDSAMFTLKLVLACFAILALTRLFVGAEAALSNGLALSQAEYIAAVGSPETGPPARLLVQAH